jgi:putative transposase
MAITDEVLNELLREYQKPEDLLGKNGLLKQLQKRLLEKALGAELTDHLGYEKHEAAGRNSGNSRNGSGSKTLKGEFGELPLAVPRDRNGTFEPQIVGKGQRRFEGFDHAIISLYARGLTTREIEGHLLEIYGVEVSPTLVSHVTDAVSADVQLWQNRPAGRSLPDCVFRCPVGQSPREQPGGEGGGVFGAGDHDDGPEGGPGHVGGQYGGSQVLAACVDGD